PGAAQGAGEGARPAAGGAARGRYSAQGAGLLVRTDRHDAGHDGAGRAAEGAPRVRAAQGAARAPRGRPMSRVDELLASAGTSDAAALERMRGALKAEAAKPMSRSWKGDAVLVLAAAWGAAVATAAFLIMAGQSGAE